MEAKSNKIANGITDDKGGMKKSTPVALTTSMTNVGNKKTINEGEQKNVQNINKTVIKTTNPLSLIDVGNTQTVNLQNCEGGKNETSFVYESTNKN